MYQLQRTTQSQGLPSGYSLPPISWLVTVLQEVNENMEVPKAGKADPAMEEGEQRSFPVNQPQGRDRLLLGSSCSVCPPSFPGPLIHPAPPLWPLSCWLRLPVPHLQVRLFQAVVFWVFIFGPVSLLCSYCLSLAQHLLGFRAPCWQ